MHNLDGLVPAFVVVVGLIGWGVIEFILWLASMVSVSFGG